MVIPKREEMWSARANSKSFVIGWYQADQLKKPLSLQLSTIKPSISDKYVIPPLRRHGKLNDPERIELANLVAQARLDGLFGHRWKCETINSVIKRKFGDTVRPRTTRYHFREIFDKGLVYNIHVCDSCSL